MKFLHTSDWHIGRSLYGRKRYQEFSAFLNWLCDTIKEQHIDVLLVAGDIFDTSTPSNHAQELYYRFLHDVSNTACQHIIIIGGNHDSPSFLNAPKALLKVLNVSVVGSASPSLEDEVIVLNNLSPDSSQAAIICAVPYLRDKDIRTVEAGESISDKNLKLIEGIRSHYQQVVAIAEEKRQALNNQTAPIIAMGHLFTAGGKTLDGDGVRELYVGSLAHIHESHFPASIDYLALGHLHVPQTVAGKEHFRYSGSPIAMGYGEAKQQKSVVILEIIDQKPIIELKNVPTFQALERLVGTLDQILTKLEALKAANSNAWLEIEYTGREIISNLREQLDQALADSTMEIRRIKNKRLIDRVINSAQQQETLDELTPEDVFERRLTSEDYTEDECNELLNCYHEILKEHYEQDTNAE